MKDVYILPATTPLERENIHVTHLNYNVVPNVKYPDRVGRVRHDGPKQEWEIFLALTRAMKLVSFGNRLLGVAGKAPALVHRELTPAFIISLLAAIGNLKAGHPQVCPAKPSRSAPSGEKGS